MTGAARTQGEIVIVHDQLLQRGGAERVVLAMHDAFPGSRIVTSVYDPDRTFEEFRDLDVHALHNDRLGLFSGDFRRSLALLAPLFAAHKVEADTVICSSAGWSHAVRTSGRKIVYCHTPARWLHNFSELESEFGRPSTFAAHSVAPMFRAWDRRAAATADHYVTNSHAVRERISDVYGVDATVIHPPAPLHLAQADPQRPHGVDMPFTLTVARIQAYKKIETVMEVGRRMPERLFIVVGDGAALTDLRSMTPPNVRLLGAVSDNELAWLYRNCRELLAPAFEDFGLTPIEASIFGKPTVAHGWGGHLETIEPGINGLLTDTADPGDMMAALLAAGESDWDADLIRAHAKNFSHSAFIEQMRAVVQGRLAFAEQR